MNPSRSVIEDGAVAINGDRIESVGPSEALALAHPAAKIIDCRGKAVIPGMIDAHGHGGHSLLKTLGVNTPSLWMRIVTPTYFHFTDVAFWHADGMVSALERLHAGVTCGVSVMGSAPRSDDPAIADGHARAYADVGVREIVCVGPCAPPWPHPMSRWHGDTRERREVSFDDALAGAEASIAQWHHGAEDRIRVFITPFTIVPSIDPSNPTPPDQATALTEHDLVQAYRIRDIAKRLGTRIHSDAFGGSVRMAYRNREAPLLGPDVHLQHCTDLSAEEVEILAETGTHVGHAPGGRSPVPQLMAAGVNVAITTDGHSSNSFDLFQSARKAQLAQRVRTGDPYLLPAGKLLEMVTIDAARAVGWDDDLGSLESGKKADLVVVDMRRAHLVPNWMVVHRLIYEAVGGDVEMVMVDGRILLDKHRVLTVDEEAALVAGEEQAWALVDRAGLRPHLNDPGWGRLRLGFDEPVPLPEQS